MENQSKDQIKCEHDWQIITYDQQKGPGVAECKKCGLWLHHSNRLQLEMNKHILGFQKWMTIVAIIISIISLVFAIIAIFKK